MQELAANELLRVLLAICGGLSVAWGLGRMFTALMRAEHEAGRRRGRAEILEGMKRLDGRRE